GLPDPVAEVDRLALGVRLERREPELVDEREDAVPPRPDPLTAPLGAQAVRDVEIPRPAADPVARLKDQHRPPGLGEAPCRRETRDPGPDHDDVRAQDRSLRVPGSRRLLPGGRNSSEYEARGCAPAGRQRLASRQAALAPLPVFVHESPPFGGPWRPPSLHPATATARISTHSSGRASCVTPTAVHDGYRAGRYSSFTCPNACISP